MAEIGTDKAVALKDLGVPQELLVYPLTGSMYLESVGGPGASAYWNGAASEVAERQRDEFFLVACSTLWVPYLISRTFDMDARREGFDAAYMFHVKALAQLTRSIDLLSSAHCYTDSFVLVRSLHSRVNLIVLLSLAPDLFGEWMRSPNSDRFRDSNVRKELERRGIRVFPHFYRQFSDIVHNHPRALLETGYIETGVFPYIPAICNMIFVAAKLLFGIAGWVGVSMLKQFWNETSSTIDRDEVEKTDQLFQYLIDNVLVPQRFDHLFTIIAKDRHWRKQPDGTFVFCEAFDYMEYRKLLASTHETKRS